MRWLALLFVLGCSRTSPPPVNVEATPSTTPASASASASASAFASAPASASASVAIPPFDLMPGGLTPALLERLAREADAIPAGKLVTKPPPDAERDKAIAGRFGQRCRLERTCGPLWGVDCDAAVDGPYYYVRVRKDQLEEITVCGGACMGGRCKNCPPKKEGWTCPTY